jgi:hypothetical protein
MKTIITAIALLITCISYAQVDPNHGMTGREETTGIQTINDNRSFNAFMQGDEIIIAALNNDVLEGTINIYSLNGTLINSMVVNNSQVAISTAGYKSGIYIIEANQPQGKFVDKVFVLGK